MKVNLKLIANFLDCHCKYKNHYCDGKHIPCINNVIGVDVVKMPDKEPCEHFPFRKMFT